MSEKILEQQKSESAKAFLPAAADESTPAFVSPRLVLPVTICLLGSSLPAGYCLGVINTPHEIIRGWVREAVMASYTLQLSHTAEVSVWAIIVSLFVGGAIMGASVGGRLTDTVGRRTALLLNHLLCLVSAFFLMFCKFFGSVEMLVAGRFLSGLYTGLATCIVPLYLSELAPPPLKGVMGVVFPMGMCAGILVSQILGLDCILGTESGWPLLLGGYVVVVCVAVLSHPALPESPIYCYAVMRDGMRGSKALQHLRGRDSKAVEAEESALNVPSHQINKEQWNSSWSAVLLLRSSSYRLPLLLTVVANAAQQLSGVNAVFYYSTLIFRSAGLDMQQSQGASIGAGAINSLMGLLALPLIKYYRRRVLFLSSMVLGSVCQCVMVVALYLLPTHSWASYVAIVSLLAYVTTYGIGLGPVPFMIATELFPAGPRSVGIAVGGTTNWFCNLVVGLTFPLIQAQIGEFSFLLFITSSCVFGSFIYRYLPETFGRGGSSESQEEVSTASSKRTVTDYPELESDI